MLSFTEFLRAWCRSFRTRTARTPAWPAAVPDPAVPWPANPGIAYVEHRAGALYLEEAHEIDAHSVAFEHLAALALSPYESLALV
ncbi:Scr1 family TA system antitoxin-like transcriptional regulator [Streptomyces sp. NBC_00654]|uniref:Scr1 family TA system antitoxin-like transcriptional regulator n=1 Tax=Streptomyces sp. NBC_00654 TaxID=2975799 RepID=UPI00338F2491